MEDLATFSMCEGEIRLSGHNETLSTNDKDSSFRVNNCNDNEWVMQCASVTISID